MTEIKKSRLKTRAHEADKTDRGDASAPSGRKVQRGDCLFRDASEAEIGPFDITASSRSGTHCRVRPFLPSSTLSGFIYICVYTIYIKILDYLKILVNVSRISLAG